MSFVTRKQLKKSNQYKDGLIRVVNEFAHVDNNFSVLEIDLDTAIKFENCIKKSYNFWSYNSRTYSASFANIVSNLYHDLEVQPYSCSIRMEPEKSFPVKLKELIDSYKATKDRNILVAIKDLVNKQRRIFSEVLLYIKRGIRRAKKSIRFLKIKI